MLESGLLLAELPPPPLSKTGWPWTEESKQRHEMMPNGAPWPRVSIVTPTFNQAQFIEETIRSVLLQGYPNLEYVIIDGGSTDGSVEIIRKYVPWLTYWVSEPDRGQSHAINKGFERVTGELVAWLNSDDSYLPGVISQAVHTLHASNADVVYANCRLVDPEGRTIRVARPPRITLRSLVHYWYDDHVPPQPSMFFTRRALEAVGPLKENLQYAMDYDLWLRLAERYRFEYLDAEWATYTVHPASKTYQGWERFESEWYPLSRPYWRQFGPSIYLDYNLRYQGRCRLNQAFDAYDERDWANVRRHLFQSIMRQPSYLKNRGVRSVMAQSIFGEDTIHRLKSYMRQLP